MPFRHAFWSVHQHSRFSANDALPHVSSIVERAAELGYPAIGLTDHGSVAGCVQLYKAAAKHGIKPLPGIEAYITPDITNKDRTAVHLTIAAYNEAGYRNLVALATASQKAFHYKPWMDMAMFASASEAGALDGLMIATGCHFGLIPTLIRTQGYDSAVRVTKTLARWFPKVFVEIQHHGIHLEEQDSDRSVRQMVDLADEVGLPYIVTSDAPYVNAYDRPQHDGLKKLASWSEDFDDAIFPGIGSYHMPDANYLAQFIEPDILRTALVNLADLAEDASVRIPELDTFTLQCPDITYGGDPDAQLAEMVLVALKDSEWWDNATAHTRVADELDVIKAAGMASYMLLVADVCQWMLSQKIDFHARGSASGSLVARILGITQIDPLAWGLSFDRFLSRDRTRPPDVDLDVSHARKPEVGAYLESKYVVRQISTHMTYSIKGDEDAGEEGKRGSLMVRYGTLERKRGENHKHWHEIPPADQDLLVALGDLELFSGYGTHPCGYVLAADEKVIDQLPLTYIASSKTFVTTYDKKDVEALGLVKLDVLGLKEITAMRIAYDIAGVDPHQIPMNDRATFLKISKGDTAGVFQLKGYAMMKGCQSIKPRNMNDLAAAQALFRPAAVVSGATGQYRDRRRKIEAVPDRHRDIMVETKDTYGVLLYQEQVIAVLRAMEMPAGELTDMLDAVKASGKRGMAAAKKMIADMEPRIRELAEKRGWLDSDIDWLADALVAYADYSFNKAHAATYAEVAYRGAWMSEHHPVAFWTGMLTVFSGTEKEAGLARSCREAGVKVLGPKINISGTSYTPQVERHAVRKGLRSIKGVGVVAAEELVANYPFRSVRDIGEKCIAKKVTGAKKVAIGIPAAEAGGVITALFDAGALDGIPDNHEDGS